MTEEERQKRLAAARATIAEYEARDAEQLAEQQARDELAEAELEARFRPALAEAKSEIGEVGKMLTVVDARYAAGHLFGRVILRRCERSEWAKFQRSLEKAKGVEVDQAQEKLWRAHVVWPALAEVDRIVKELPFLSTAMADAIGRLVGLRVEELAGK